MAFITLQRLHTRLEPLERDLPIYAVLGHEVNAGRQLYSDLWDNKPPLMTATFALAERLAGYGPSQMLLMGLMASFATLLGLWAAGRFLAGGTGGAWACGLWVLIGSDLELQANQPNSEVFTNACLVGALAAVLSSDWKRPGEGKGLAAGLGFTLASLYKPTAFLGAGTLALAQASWTLVKKGAKGARWWWAWPLVVLPLCAWLVLFSYFGLSGRLDPFFNCVVQFNRSYAGNLLENIVAGTLYWPSYLRFLWPLAALSILAMVRGFSLDSRPWTLYLAYLLSIHLQITAHGHDTPHYYQLWIPALCLGAGAGLSWMTAVRRKNPRWAGWALALLVFSLLGVREAGWYALGPEDWSRRKYGEIFIYTEKMAHVLDGLLAPGETFHQFGNETGLYFYSRRKLPTGLVSDYGVFGVAEDDLPSPMAEELKKRLLADLQRERPRYLVGFPEHFPPATKWGEVGLWVGRNYAPRPGRSSWGPWRVWARKEDLKPAQAPWNPPPVP